VLWAGVKALYDVREHPDGNIPQIVLNAWL
jgi:hypothetical protein